MPPQRLGHHRASRGSAGAARVQSVHWHAKLYTSLSSFWRRAFGNVVST